MSAAVFEAAIHVTGQTFDGHTVEVDARVPAFLLKDDVSRRTAALVVLERLLEQRGIASAVRLDTITIEEPT